MIKAEFFLFIIAFFPLFSFFILKLFHGSDRLFDFSYRIFPILFIVNLTQIVKLFSKDQFSIKLCEAIRGISISIHIDKTSLGFLYFLAIIWLFFTVYSHKFLKLSRNVESKSFREFVVLFISFLNLLTLSQNLLTILLFYSAIILTGHFFAIKFLHYSEQISKFRFEEENQEFEPTQNFIHKLSKALESNQEDYKKNLIISKSFTFLLYIQTFLLFLGVVASYKMNNQIEFLNNINIPDYFDETKHRWLFSTFFFGLFLAVILPFYLFFQNIRLNILAIYVLLFLGYAFGSLVIFVKILNYVFGNDSFSLIIRGFGVTIFEILFLFNMLISSFFLIRSKNIKSSFFYLFFHQFTFLIFELIIILSAKLEQIYIPICGFFMTFTTVFFCISNISLYLSITKQTTNYGIFSKMPASCCLLFFALLAMIGIAPSIGMVDKFSLIKVMFDKKMFLSSLAFAVNSIGLTVFLWKIFREFVASETLESESEISFETNSKNSIIKNSEISLNKVKNSKLNNKNELEPEEEINEIKTRIKRELDLKNNSEKFVEIGRSIDLDSGLVLTSLVMVIAVLLGLIFSSSITNLFVFL